MFHPKFETENDLNIKLDEYQSCSTYQDLQLLYRSFLHFEKLLIYIVHKTYTCLIWFMKPYERCVIFMNNVITTLSDEEMTNIKVVYLYELFNFDIHHFSS
jgi:hypothetical protein